MDDWRLEPLGVAFTAKSSDRLLIMRGSTMEPLCPQPEDHMRLWQQQAQHRSATDSPPCGLHPP